MSISDYAGHVHARLIAIICILPALCLAQGEDVKAADRRFQAAVSQGSGVQASAAMHPSFYYVGDSGTFHYSSSFLRQVAARVARAIEQPGQVRVHGDAAAVFGESATDGRQSRFLRIWLKARGEWKLIAFQVTPLPSDQPSSGARPPNRQARSATDFIIDTAVRSDAEGELVDVFRTLQRAERSGDWAAFSAMTTDGFQVVSFNGDVRTKAQRIEEIRRQRPDTLYPAVDELKVRVFGSIAVMSARQHPVIGAFPSFRWSRLWVKDGSQWRQAINQQTAVATSQ